MRWIKEYRDRLIIQTGHIYTLSGGDYKVLTATADMDRIKLLTFHMQNIKTNGMRYIDRGKLEKEIRQYNEVKHLFD